MNTRDAKLVAYYRFYVSSLRCDQFTPSTLPSSHRITLQCKEDLLLSFSLHELDKELASNQHLFEQDVEERKKHI